MNKYKLKTGKIGNSVVDCYNKIEDSVVKGYQKIEDAFVETFLEKVEDESNK